MTENDLLSAIDSEIARLEQARNLLTDSGTRTRVKKSASTRSVNRKRVLSPEARERIVAAQRKRWAAVRKTAK